MATDTSVWSVNLLDPQVRADPFALYDALREQADIGWNRRMGMWMAVGYDAARRALSDHEAFSSRARQDHQHSLYGAATMIFSDPPAHAALRQPVTAAFAQPAVNRTEPVVRAAASALIAGAYRRGRFDLVADVTGMLPVAVISELLGVPPQDRLLLKDASDAVVSIGVAGRGRARERHSAGRRIREYFAGRVRARLRDGPRGDLLDLICAGHPSPTEEQFRELVAACMLLLVAGHETSTALMGNAVLRLLEQPGLWDRLRAEPRLIGPAVEEVIRLDGPVHTLRRWTTRRISNLGTTELEADAPVVVLLAAANRDPRYFTRPGTFLLERPDAPPHLGFGWGNHFCLGARLARLEARVLIEELLRLPRPVPDVPRTALTYVPSLIVRGLAALPMTVT